MANVTFTNCTVHINQQVNEGGIGHYYDNGANRSASQLPTELATSKAMELWQKAQEAGWIDANYQPIVSKTKASLIADYIGKKLNLSERWKPFAELWQIDSLRKDYDKAMSSPSSTIFIEQITTILGD